MPGTVMFCDKLNSGLLYQISASGGNYAFVSRLQMHRCEVRYHINDEHLGRNGSGICGAIGVATRCQAMQWVC